MLMNKINYTISLLLLLCIISNGCKKFVTVESPQTQLSSSSIFNSDATAIAAQLSIYSQMELDGLAYNIMINSGMSADEFTNYSTSVGAIDLATNNLTPDNFVVQTIWTRFYNYIYQTNAILEGLKQATKISDSTKKQLEGESKFVRAFCHFYLVSLYGDVPIINSTDYLINESAERASVNSVYTFIENDLKDAILLLGSEYLDARNLVTTERVRPNKSTASALLSRVYLYIGKWSEAEIEASKVIDYKSRYSLATSLNNSFLKNNSEAIWQLFAVYPTYNSHPGAQLILRSTPTVVALDTNFVKSFRLSDNRKLSWIQSITVSG
ncbi:MAG: RagB/SusD family nutrient uptake outer membrane protein, partial [Sediminibacterium sp.]